MTTPEGRVKYQVSKRLREIKHLWSFMPVQTGFGKPTLDYMLCAGGRFVVIETKRPGGKLTPRQEATCHDMREAGARVFVVEDDASMDVAFAYIRWCCGSYATTRFKS